MTQTDLRYWKGVDLDAMRQIGDPSFDDPIAERIEQEPEFWSELHALLVHRQPMVHLAPPVGLDELVIEPQDVRAGQRVFADHGPEILMALACYSLPAAFAAAKGVQVLNATGYIEMETNRRLWETTQMVVDVMSDGGLEGADARGTQTARRVRQLHAAVRQLLLKHPGKEWDSAELGVPINQEDMAGTLLTFSWLILDGLAKMHIELTPEEQQSYLNAWRYVGSEMGVVDELIPETVEEARELSDLIQRRQVGNSPQGREMTAAVLGWMRGQAPMLLKGFPAVMMRRFLPAKVADDLDVPRWTPEHIVVDLVLRMMAWIDRKLARTEAHRAIVRKFSMHLIDAWLSVKVKGPTEYQLADDLIGRWKAPD